jgi:outer membrane protein, heavy metal efflux system
MKRLIMTFLVAVPLLAWAQSDTLTLDHAVELALASHWEIQSAQRAVEAARAKILRAESYPNGEISAEFNNMPMNLHPGEADETTLRIAQPFEFPGKRSLRSAIASMDVRLAEVHLQYVRAQVSAGVKRAYVRAQLSMKLVENYERLVELIRQFQQTAALRYEARQVPFLEVVRSRIELAKISNQQIEERQRLKNAFAILRQAMGQEGSLPMSLPSELSYEPLGQQQSEAVQQLLQNRTAIRKMIIKEERSAGSLSLARKSYLPDFSVGIAYQ